MDSVKDLDENSIEKKMCRIWMFILKIETVGIDDNFFELGGDSFKAAFLSVRIQKELDIEVPVDEILLNPTIRGLLEYINGTDSGIQPCITPANEREFYPSSLGQKGLFILEEQYDLGLTYNLPTILEIEGYISKDRLEEAFNTLIKRHESLRTSFDLIDGELVQIIHNSIEFKLGYTESVEGREKDLIKELITPFNLREYPLIRAWLVKYSEKKHILLFDIHHIVADGVSFSIFLHELTDIYMCKELAPLKIQYKDYCVWQNEILNSEVIDEQENYWMNIFSDGIPTLDLPTDFTRPIIRSFEGERVDFSFDKNLGIDLNKLTIKAKTTLNMVLIAAYNILMAKYTRQEDIVIGTLASGRVNNDLEGLIGMFVNTLALRSRPESGKTFLSFLEEVKNDVIMAYKNQQYNLMQLVSKFQVNRDVSRNPLFDVGFVAQNMENPEIDLPDSKFKPYKYMGIGSKFDLFFEVYEKSNDLTLTVEYCTKLFKSETIQRMAKHYENILKQISNNPEICLADIKIMSEEEKNQLLIDFNNTSINYPGNKTIQQLIEEQVEKTPDNTALIFGQNRLTYRELNEKSNQLARSIRGEGIKPDDIVGIMINRSMDMIIGILAVLKSGGAYLPIDPEYPEERIKYMLNDSGTKLLLTSNEYKQSIDFKGKVIEIESGNLYKGDCSNLDGVNNSKDLAYVIYTSGSTGKPKGVLIEHKAVINFIKGMTEQIEFTSEKTILALTTISFDIFLLETLLPLTTGMKVVIANEDQQRDPKLLNKVIIENKVDMLQTTPTRIQLLISDDLSKTTLEGLKEIMVGGEALPQTLLSDLNRMFKGKIYNMYGPTETTVWSTVKNLTNQKDINIGKPIANTQIYIIDKNNKPQPIGVVGELCIAGDGLARGYLNKPELTEEKFVPNLVKPDDKMYKTGDLATWLPNGEIAFLGRIDHQVKVRGFRIELGEVQTQLLAIPQIKDAVVIDRTDADGNNYLCAYLVSDEEINGTELVVDLAKELPEYMIPSYFVKLDRIPLTSNGKIDRKSLPGHDNSIQIGQKYVAPETEIQIKIAKVWEAVLGKKQIGIDDDFFKKGGHSLLAIKLEVELEKIGLEINYLDLYKYKTIRKMSVYIESAKK